MWAMLRGEKQQMKGREERREDMVIQQEGGIGIGRVEDSRIRHREGKTHNRDERIGVTTDREVIVSREGRDVQKEEKLAVNKTEQTGGLDNEASHIVGRIRTTNIVEREGANEQTPQTERKGKDRDSKIRELYKERRHKRKDSEAKEDIVEWVDHQQAVGSRIDTVEDKKIDDTEKEEHKRDGRIAKIIEKIGNDRVEGRDKQEEEKKGVYRGEQLGGSNDKGNQSEETTRITGEEADEQGTETEKKREETDSKETERYRGRGRVDSDVVEESEDDFGELVDRDMLHRCMEQFRQKQETRKEGEWEREGSREAEGGDLGRESTADKKERQGYAYTHKLESIYIGIVETVRGVEPFMRKVREAWWINRLKTLEPSGFNVKLECNQIYEGTG